MHISFGVMSGLGPTNSVRPVGRERGGGGRSAQRGRSMLSTIALFCDVVEADTVNAF